MLVPNEQINIEKGTSVSKATRVPFILSQSFYPSTSSQNSRVLSIGEMKNLFDTEKGVEKCVVIIIKV